VKVQVPPARLSSRSIYSRNALRLSPDEVQAWNERNRQLLSIYGLEVASVTILPLDLVSPRAGARAGLLQTGMRDRLLLTAMLGALAVSISGRGDLLELAAAERDRLKRTAKENNDRNATAIMTEALHALCGAHPGTRLRIAIGEGARLKPGERGGNPTLYAGQTLGSGDTSYSIAVDTVEGTTKSTLFDHSCGTLLFATEASIAAVPDVYFDKCQVKGITQVSVNDPLDRIVEAIMDTSRTQEINIFALDRARHPIERMLDLGANMRIDTDGDAYPVVAAGLAWGVYPDNLRPLDGVCGNIGGAAEMIASAAGGYYLGVESTARFCAAKIKTWEDRYNFAPEEEESLRCRGFDPHRVYRIDELVPGLQRADGAFVAAAISDNWHIPGLDACFVGGNFASVSALFVGSAGTADLYRLEFTYSLGLERTAEVITPVLTRILGLPVASIPQAVRAAVADPSRAGRLKHELATTYYMHLRGDSDKQPAEGRLQLDLDAASKVESPEAMEVLHAVVDAAPDWFC
jgi:fructose-1,6-bisphosphatase/sedoheptulose 1,7-bisphosphatase-like protein